MAIETENLKAREILLRFEHEFSIDVKHRKTKIDSRRLGKNRYADVICESFDVIQRLLSGGKSRNAVFRVLQENGIFDDDADVSTFYRVLKRESERRGINLKIPRYLVSSADSVHSVPHGETGEVEEGVEYVRDAKCYVMWKGTEIFIPEGSCFSRGTVRPKAKDFGDDTANIEGKRYSFSDYPKHIQDAMSFNLDHYPKLDAAKRNKTLVRDWLSAGAQK